MLICYLTIGMVNSLALLVLSFMIMQNYALPSRIKKILSLANFVAFVIIIVEMGTTYFELKNIAFNGWYIFCNVLGFSLSPMVAVLLGNAFHTKGKRYQRLLFIPLVTNILLSLLSSRFGFIFQTTPDNLYLRGPFFFVYILTYLCCTLYFLHEIFLSIKKHPDASRYTLILLFVFILVGTSIQIAIPNIHVSWLCITFTLILCYAYLCELNLKIDALTHLFNRFAYEHYLHAWGKSKNAYILLFDVDKFKEINDRYGHTYGDNCLVIVANCINKVFSPIGSCYRIGGDEFCVLIPSKDDKLIQHTIKLFHKNLDFLRKTDPVIPYVSIGYSLYNKSNGTLKQAVKRADAHMYRCKAEKKAKHCTDKCHSKPSLV